MKARLLNEALSMTISSYDIRTVDDLKAFYEAITKAAELGGLKAAFKRYLATGNAIELFPVASDQELKRLRELQQSLLEEKRWTDG